MSTTMEIIRLVLVYVGITAIYLILRTWFVKLSYGIIGLILLILPAALAMNRNLGPFLLIFNVAGLFILLADIARKRNLTQRERGWESDKIKTPGLVD